MHSHYPKKEGHRKKDILVNVHSMSELQICNCVSGTTLKQCLSSYISLLNIKQECVFTRAFSLASCELFSITLL